MREKQSPEDYDVKVKEITEAEFPQNTKKSMEMQKISLTLLWALEESTQKNSWKWFWKNTSFNQDRDCNRNL